MSWAELPGRNATTASDNSRKSDDYRTSRLSTAPTSAPQESHRPNSGTTVPTDARLGWKSMGDYRHEDGQQRHDATMTQIGLTTAPVTWTPTDNSRQEYQTYPALVAPNTFAPEQPYAPSSASFDTGSSPRIAAPKGVTQRVNQMDPRTSFIDYLEPYVGNSRNDGTDTPTPRTSLDKRKQDREYNPFPSPVDLGLLSEPEARNLFHQ